MRQGGVNQHKGKMDFWPEGYIKIALEDNKEVVSGDGSKACEVLCVLRERPKDKIPFDLKANK